MQKIFFPGVSVSVAHSAMHGLQTYSDSWDALTKWLWSTYTDMQLQDSGN